MNIICCAVSFGLGPTGKLASIVSASPEYNWYLCGDKIDEFVFKKNVFKDKLFTRDKKKIEAFVKRNNIEIAIVILDGLMATLLKNIGLKVIYVDSLPFMWQQSDVELGDVPLEVDCYCAQKNYNKANSNVLSQAYNLVNIDPILPVMNYKKTSKKYDLVINLGGLNIDGLVSTSYINCIMPSIIKFIGVNDYKCIITCGKDALDYIKSKYKDLNNIEVSNLEHEQFINTIYTSDLIVTTSGLTTLLEISQFNKKVILLPPNNLSQYYNQEIAKTLLRKYRIINWDNKELLFDKIKENLALGEEKTVEMIQEKIKNMVNKTDIYNELMSDIFIHNNESLKIQNGTIQIKKILNNI